MVINSPFMHKNDKRDGGTINKRAQGIFEGIVSSPPFSYWDATNLWWWAKCGSVVWLKHNIVVISSPSRHHYVSSPFLKWPLLASHQINSLTDGPSPSSGFSCSQQAKAKTKQWATKLKLKLTFLVSTTDNKIRLFLLLWSLNFNFILWGIIFIFAQQRVHVPRN